MSHDQLSKSLIATFFHDFLHLTAPDSAPRLRPGEATFVDKEFFTDWPTGKRRELDLLAQVPVEEGELPVLVHVEIETKARAGMEQRLWRYYMQIRLRHDLLVLPILVNLRGGRPGAGLEVLEEGLDRSPVAFPYRVLGLSGCQAQDWLARPEPVAWAFAGLMRPGKWSRAELKIECLRRVAGSGVTEREKEVLVNWLKTCVKLSGQNAAEFERLLELEENKEIRQMETTWLGRAEAKGVKKGIEKGTAQAVEQMRGVVLQQMKQRFGAVPESIQKRVEAIDSLKLLADAFSKILLAGSPDEVVSPRRRRQKREMGQA
jgi:hypothetical protein